MIIVTQAQLRNKDTEAIILLRNKIKAKFNTNAIDYFTISAVAEILYNKFKHKNHDIIYHTTVSYDGIKFVVVVFLMVKLNVENVELKQLEEERVDYDTM